MEITFGTDYQPFGDDDKRRWKRNVIFRCDGVVSLKWPYNP